MPSTVATGKKPRVLLWQDLNIEELHKIRESTDKLATIADVFGLTNYKEDLRSSVLLDLYFYTVQYSEKKGFNDEQTSALVSIVKTVHEKAVETPYGNVDDTFQYFKELLLCHSVKRPPFSIQLYSTDQVQMIADYVTNTYFKHYKLYKYAFTPKVSLKLNFEYSDAPDIPVEEDDGEPNNEDKLESPEEVKKEVEPVVQETVEDSPAVKELKSLITETLNEQVNKLRSSVEEQLKVSNDMLTQKFGFPCGGKEPAKQSPATQKKKGK